MTKPRNMFQIQMIGDVTFVEISISLEDKDAIDVKKKNHKPLWINIPNDIIK